MIIIVEILVVIVGLSVSKLLYYYHHLKLQ